jgi:hypothetical protein
VGQAPLVTPIFVQHPLPSTHEKETGDTHSARGGTVLQTPFIPDNHPESNRRDGDIGQCPPAGMITPHCFAKMLLISFVIVFGVVRRTVKPVCSIPPNGAPRTPIRKNPDEAATGNAKEEHAQPEQGYLQRVSPGPYISLHPLRVNQWETSRRYRYRESRPVHRSVPVLGFPNPRGVADYSSYRRNNYKKHHEENHAFDPD